MAKKLGVILINLGTPDEPTPEAVGRYLKEFLMDPFVVDIPAPLRWFLVNVLIVPRRKFSSSHAYQSIWGKDSPLRTAHLELTELVRNRIGEIPIEPAMRYGQPSIPRALVRLKEQGCERLLVLPLYPQFSLAATESSLRFVRSELEKLNWAPELQEVRDFHDDPDFIDAYSEVALPVLNEFKPDAVIFSFHGLPERQIHKTDRSAQASEMKGTHCLNRPNCCDEWVDANRDCYRAQCFRTAELLASQLEIAPDRRFVAFQSRLGRTPWIRPYTDELYEELPRKGVKRVAVVCPSFVSDCLETLEEIAIRGKEAFIEAGGSDLKLVPSLNTHPAWQGVVSKWILEKNR